MKRFLHIIVAVSILSVAVFAQTPTTLKVEKPLESDLKGGETQQLQVDLQKGKFLNALVNQQDIDVIVRVFAPSGEKIAEVDAPLGVAKQSKFSIKLSI